MDISKLKVGAIIRWNRPDYSPNSKTFMVAGYELCKDSWWVLVKDIEGKWSAIDIDDVDLILE